MEEDGEIDELDSLLKRFRRAMLAGLRFMRAGELGAGSRL